MKHLFAFMLLFCSLSLFGQLPETNIEHSYNRRGAYLPQGIAGFADSMYMMMSWKRFNADGSERPGDRGTPVWIHADSLSKAGVFGGGGKGITEALVFKGDSLTFQQKTWINTTKNSEVLAVKPAGSDSLYFMKKRDGKLVKISSILIPSGGGGEKIVFADKLNLMYVSIADYTAKYDISDTYNPIFLSNEALSGQITSYDPFKNVLISTNNTGTFYVYSTNLELLATHAFFGNILQSPDWTEVRDERAYISCRGEGVLGSNIVTIDYSNLDSVYTVDTLKFAEGRPPGGIGIHGSIIYTYSTDSLFAIETNAENPFVLSLIALPDSVQTNSLVPGNVGVWPANGLTIIGERAFVAAPNKDQVWVFNISDPDNIFYDFLIDFPAGSSVSSTEYFKGLLVFGSSKNESLYQILGNNSAEKIQSNIIESAVLSAINIDAKSVASKTIYAQNSIANNGYFTGNLSFSKYSEKTTKDPVYLIGVDSNGNVLNVLSTGTGDGNGIISALPLGSVAINAADNNLNITELAGLSFSTVTDTTAGAVQSRVLAGSFSSIPTGLRRIQADTAKVEMLGDALILQDSSGKYAAHNFNQANLYATGGFQSGKFTGVYQRLNLPSASGYKSGAQTGDVSVETAWTADTDSTFTLRSGTWKIDYNVRGRVDIDSAGLFSTAITVDNVVNIPSIYQFRSYHSGSAPFDAHYANTSGFAVISIAEGASAVISVQASVSPNVATDYEIDRVNLSAVRIGKP